ncbi:hypothetical protein [Winogradskyella sp.]|uniref:hypothetical protein n=1 Tax=Winogradskyella sp. TaxID=1883156 RepID=UPI002635B5C5|nr:hypothetical protein [Winogradskyella sp.]
MRYYSIILTGAISLVFVMLLSSFRVYESHNSKISLFDLNERELYRTLVLDGLSFNDPDQKQKALEYFDMKENYYYDFRKKMETGNAYLIMNELEDKMFELEKYLYLNFDEFVYLGDKFNNMGNNGVSVTPQPQNPERPKKPENGESGSDYVNEYNPVAVVDFGVFEKESINMLSIEEKVNVIIDSFANHK